MQEEKKKHNTKNNDMKKAEKNKKITKLNQIYILLSIFQIKPIK